MHAGVQQGEVNLYVELIMEKMEGGEGDPSNGSSHNTTTACNDQDHPTDPSYTAEDEHFMGLAMQQVRDYQEVC